MIVTRITTTVSGESKVIHSEASESIEDNNSQDEENININAVSDATVSGLPEDDQEQEGQQPRQLNSLEDDDEDEEEASEPSASPSSSESVKEEKVRSE